MELLKIHLLHFSFFQFLFLKQQKHAKKILSIMNVLQSAHRFQLNARGKKRGGGVICLAQIRIRLHQRVRCDGRQLRVLRRHVDGAQIEFALKNRAFLLKC